MDLGHHHNVGFPVGANFEHGVAGSSTLIHARTSSSVTLKTIYYFYSSAGIWHPGLFDRVIFEFFSCIRYEVQL